MNIRFWIFLLFSVGWMSPFTFGVPSSDFYPGSCDTRDTVSTTACDSFYWPLSGLMYYQSTLDSMIIPNMAGCDSIITLSLSLQFSVHTYDTIVECDVYFGHGGIYDVSGDYNFVDATGPGCPRITHLNLTIHPSWVQVTDISQCRPYFWPFTGYTYSSSTYLTYTYTRSVTGCDSSYVLDLIISPVNTGVLNQAPTLTSQQAFAQYQWVNCGLGYQPIIGAINRSFTAVENGSYAVIVTYSNCSDTSLCHYITNVSRQDPTESMGFDIYPNPASSELVVSLPPQPLPSLVAVFNHAGMLVQSVSAATDQLHLDVSQWQPGYYFLKVGGHVRPFIKL